MWDLYRLLSAINEYNQHYLFLVPHTSESQIFNINILYGPYKAIYFFYSFQRVTSTKFFFFFSKFPFFYLLKQKAKPTQNSLIHFWKLQTMNSLYCSPLGKKWLNEENIGNHVRKVSIAKFNVMHDSETTQLDLDIFSVGHHCQKLLPPSLFVGPLFYFEMWQHILLFENSTRLYW